MISLIIESYSHALLTLWDSVAHWHPRQKESTLRLTVMLHLRGTRHGAGTPSGPITMRGQRSPQMKCHSPLSGRARAMWTVRRSMTHSDHLGLATVSLATLDNPRWALKSNAASSSWTSLRWGAVSAPSLSRIFCQPGPGPVPSQLRQCLSDIFHCFCTDGTIQDVVTDGGTRQLQP